MDWFKVWPSRYLNVINRIADGDLRAAFSLLLWHCLNENGIPDDDDEIIFLTGIKPERIKDLRPYLKRLATSKNGRLVLVPAEETICERQEFAAKKAKAGEAGGKQKQANKENVNRVLAEASSASEILAKATTAKLCLPLASQTNKQTNKQEVVESAPPANNNDDVFSSIENQNALAKSVADAMGMPDVPEGKPGELMRSAIEDFRLAGITAEEVTVFVKEWYARKIKAGQSHYVLSLPFLIQDLPGWAKARKMKSQSKLKAVPAACARCQGTKTINKFDEQGWAGVAECPDCQKREVA